MADIITKKKDEAEFNAPTELRPKMSVELAYLEESVDPVVERKALRKIDSVVMPLVRRVMSESQRLIFDLT